MQEFENGAPVTITYAENGKKRDCKHVGMNGLLHVVDLGNSVFCEFGDDYIRPIQLICDEAMEVIKNAELECFFFGVDSEQINRETQDLLFSLGFRWRNGSSYHDWNFNNIVINGEADCAIITHSYDKDHKRAEFELNLKTGEITPTQLICEEAREKILKFAEDKKPMMFYVESDKQLSELCDFMEGVCIVPNKQYNRGAKLVSWRDGYQCLNQLDHRVAGHCKELGFNELNLKTGEVKERGYQQCSKRGKRTATTI